MSITKYKKGSLAEIWKIAFPLMLSSFSAMCMLFIDRLLLANYSTEALTAVVTASTLGWVFNYGYMVFTSISEVFVAQYNGAQLKNKLGEPVWQTIWIALLSFVIFVPLAFFGGTIFFGAGAEKILERQYFGWMMLFSPFFAIYTALCGFFIGQGKTLLITLLALVTNGINALLDAVLIFGYEGYCPSLGIEGAAIATSISGVFQAVVLFAVFLNKKNRKEHNTGCCKIKLDLLISCIRIGFPSALFAFFEILGWAFFYNMMSYAGERYILIAGICQSIGILFYFIAEGVGKAAMTLAGNRIGANQQYGVVQVLFSGVLLHGLFFVALSMLFFLTKDMVITLFLPDKDAEFIASISPMLVACLYGMLFYIFFEGMRLLFSGLLTAAGDTIFLLIAGTVLVWLLMVAPVYFIAVLGYADAGWAWFCCIFYNAITAAVLAMRFFKGTWRNINILAHS